MLANADEAFDDELLEPLSVLFESPLPQPANEQIVKTATAKRAMSLIHLFLFICFTLLWSKKIYSRKVMLFSSIWSIIASDSTLRPFERSLAPPS